ncbi:TENA/THI-4 family protein [Amylibacter sp. SFDW26]|uniref:TenA family protein n=1 Tax=Amylibacter sp. SFDW26 TaxID=2652722 RepID=UPI001261FFB2|nr:TenA family protein [Amylibacter sp. SFDW26]KAB7615316.1 TENA/THI-4 family protein [Amylibacter sp. SFDW26]
MRPTDYLISLCPEDWDAATKHPFCDALADGTLDLDKMRGYLVQDYQFIDGFVRLLASAIAHAPTLADSVPAAQFLALITGPENTYFLRSFEALGVTDIEWQNAELKAATMGFQELMTQATSSGKYEEMLAVLVVAEWIYLSWATPVNPPKDDLPFYFAEWITLHAGEGFEGVVEYLRSQLDAQWGTLDAAGRANVEQVFCKAVKLERDFFDASWA